MIKVSLELRRSENIHIGFVYVKFYILSENVYFSTRVQCNRKHWNEKTFRVKPADPYYSDKNLIIESVLARINNVFVKYRLKDKQLTKAIFLRNYNRPDDYTTFHQFCTDYQRQTSRSIEVSTMNMHNSVLHKLKDYAPDLYFDQLTKDFLEGYISHLKKKLHNNDNTAHKNMAVIRKFVRAAITAGYMETNPFDNFYVRQSKPNVVFLTEEELTTLYKIYIKGNYNPKWTKTYQAFLFMCFGSLHIGDARTLKIENFTNVNFTYYRIKLQNKKPEPVTVPISMPLRRLLNDIIGDRQEGHIFEGLPADQTMNGYLKKIAEYAHVNKLITNKTGRHTFATIFLEYNPNPKTLQDILGHSDIKQTMMYVHALEKTKQRGIECFDRFEE